MRIAGKEVNLRNKPTFIKFQLQVLGNVEPSNATSEVGETATVTVSVCSLVWVSADKFQF